MTVRHRFSQTNTPGIDFTHAEPLTKQSAKDECDINLIMRKFVSTGIVEHGNRHQGNYGLVPAIDFHQAQELIQDSEDMFDELPAAIRRRFHNNPSSFLAFCEDPNNLEEAVLLGLSEPPAPAPATEPAPPPVPEVPPASSEPS